VGSCGSRPSSGQRTLMRGDYHHPQRHPVSSLPSSRTLADTDAGGGLDKNARLGDTGYDPVIEVDELQTPSSEDPRVVAA
jgi:hypothetical protein